LPKIFMTWLVGFERFCCRSLPRLAMRQNLTARGRLPVRGKLPDKLIVWRNQETDVPRTIATPETELHNVFPYFSPLRLEANLQRPPAFWLSPCLELRLDEPQRLPWTGPSSRKPLRHVESRRSHWQGKGSLTRGARAWASKLC